MQGRELIDMEYLVMAWQDESADTAYYLDVFSGSIQQVRRELIDCDDLVEEIESNQERYLYVPKPAPSELKSDLADFIATISDPSLGRLLQVAYESPVPLNAVKSVLASHAHKLKEWESFREKRVRQRVTRWLDANFVQIRGLDEDFDPDVEDFSP